MVGGGVPCVRAGKGLLIRCEGSGWKAMLGEGAWKAAQGWEVAGGGRKDMRGAAVVGQ